MHKVLVLGSSGKLGQALVRAFAGNYEVVGRSFSGGLDAGDHSQLQDLVERVQPRIVCNAVALSGLDACERDPAKALQLNTLLPRFLARCCRRQGSLLVHFSTDAVFNGLRSSGCYGESDLPSPTNLYGFTKFGGDAFLAAEADQHYVFRLSVLAGPPGRSPQFLEKMIARARAGETLQVADDVICSPSYVKDIAEVVRNTVELGLPFGLYHTANSGAASLYDLVEEVLRGLHLETKLEPVSHRQFPSLAPMTLRTPLRSEKTEPLRDWREAIGEYCRQVITSEAHTE